MLELLYEVIYALQFAGNVNLLWTMRYALAALNTVVGLTKAWHTAVIANEESASCLLVVLCMPCPYGLDIPGIFVHYNKCVNKGNVPESQQAENYQKARRAFLVGYDRSVPRLRQANHCIQCRECIPHCPQQIDIPRELQRVDNFVEKLKQGTL